MKALKKTLFILATTMVIGYTIRHIYLKWIEPHTSVLDKYDTAVTNEIKKATTLQQLEELYREAHQKVLALDKEDSIKEMEHYKRTQLEPYQTEAEIRNAIISWEAKSKEIFQIRFYWAIGFVLILIGFVLYRKVNVWLGVTILITGFGEMVYWTSPSFFGSGVEYDKLLTNKIILSIATLAFLLVAGFLTDTLKSNSE